MWLEFLPGGRALAVSDRQGFVQLWDVARQREVFQFDAAQSQRHRRRAPIVGMHVLSPDGRLMSMDLDDEAMPRIWEVATGKEVLRLQGRRRMGFKQLQFSPDGKRLLTIDDDRLIHVWDLRELPDVSRPVPGPLSEAELRRLWTLLEQPTADGFRAGLTLSHKPEQAIDLIRRHLHAAPKRDAKRIAELVAQLDSEESADRDRASRELQTLGRVAEPELQAAVDKPLSAEAARRVRGLLAALQHPVAAPAELRAVRAIGVLEWIGSPAALEVLRETANGEPLARETQTAAEALKRLSAK